MAEDFTTVELLANTKRRGFIPTGAGLDTSALLRVLSEQLRTYIPAFLKGLREEYLIATLRVTVTSDTVPVPARAVGAALRTAKWVGTDLRETQITRIEPERRQDFALTAATPEAYYFQGNNLILVPAVSSGTIVLTYQQRPGKLVLPSSCAKLIDQQDTFVWAVESVPNSMVAGVACDIVSATPNFKLLTMDAVVQSIAPGSPPIMSFTADLPTDLAAGDYVCLSGETCIPQIPQEVHDLLAQAAAYQVASDTGSKRLGSIKDSLAELRAQLTILLTPRNDGSPRVIVNRSGLGRRFF